MQRVRQRFGVEYDYDVAFTRDAFDLGNPDLAACFDKAGAGPHPVLPVIDSGVLQSDPDLPGRIERYFAARVSEVEIVASPFVVRGGEICKTDPREVTEIWDLAARHGLCRHSFILVIGGGAVIDAVGYAAATTHRGLRLFRMPSTVLGQNDAGIGVKCAINHGGRKNFVGAFAPPFAVLNDFELLRTLPARDLRAGIAEAIKVSLIRDAAFFESLYLDRKPLSAFVPEPMERMIVRCADLHLQHIRSSGDPFELGSARPLDFGHWSAHKLEESSRGRLRHGEAVAIGIALDSLYSSRVGMLAAGDAERILILLRDLGFDLAPPELRDLDIDEALSDFREHLGSALCITLLEGIGRGVEVGEIDATAMGKCVDALLDA